MSSVSALYEPLIGRDLDAIEPAIRAFRRGASADDLFVAIARFAVLSFAPSQHAKHAMLATLSAWELRDDLGERFDEVLVECARYVAESRQPWSEPPIIDPPAVDDSTPRDPAELRAAVRDRDRLRGERWLAARLGDDELARDLALVAAEDAADLGHKLIITNAALKLVPILGAKGKFVTLRAAVWEITSYEGEKTTPRAIDSASLLDSLIANTNDVETAHGVFLFDAAVERNVLDRVAGVLSVAPAPSPALKASTHLQPYRLARDLGATLKAHAVVKRLKPKFPNVDFDRFLSAVHHNLEYGPSLEEWSFA
ncbi:MAG TPA: hypothetical protein VF057_00275 [Thermoanaerobaculia bacterium]